MVEVADALEVLTKTSNWRLAADDRWTLAENNEVCDAAAESLAGRRYPPYSCRSSGRGTSGRHGRLTMPLRGCHACGAAGRPCARAVGDAVDKFGVAPDDATVVAAAVIAHLPFTSERPMRDRVEDEVSGHLEARSRGVPRQHRTHGRSLKA